MGRDSKTPSASHRRSDASSNHSTSSASGQHSSHPSTGSGQGNPRSYAQPNGSQGWYQASDDPSQSYYGQQAGSRTNSYRASHSQASAAGSYPSYNDQPRREEPGWSRSEREKYARELPGPSMSQAQPLPRNHDPVMNGVSDLVYGYSQRPFTTHSYGYPLQLDDNDFGASSSSRQSSSSSRRETSSRSSRR